LNPSDKDEDAKGTPMLHLLWEAIIGIIVGALAKLIMPGKDPGGVWITMAIGVVGSLIAGIIGRAVGWYESGQSAGFIMSVFGALLLLAVYRMFKKKTA
jgi:uncharacterized membrane protein YeaQ/YmgE (transglycosylase-associated protein family)